MGDPTHCPDHVDVWPGAAPHHYPTQNRQNSRSGAAEGYVSGLTLFSAHYLMLPLLLCSQALLRSKYLRDNAGCIPKEVREQPN